MRARGYPRASFPGRIQLNRLSANGGGVWLFGSRAAGCARVDSDWDLLVLTSLPPQEARRKFADIEIVYVSLADLEARRKFADIEIVYVSLADLDIWVSTELAAHVADFGIRLDSGNPIKINSNPAAAAARKQALVATRSRFLDRLWVAFRPEQLKCELLRLRRNAHRGWVLAEGHGPPPTALLDQRWSIASKQMRASILAASDLAPRVYDALLE
jgi:predicted nucleotidyltransferase